MKPNELIRSMIFALVTIMCSCDCKSWGDYDLGNRFRLMAGDGDDQTILIYCTSTESCCNAGIELVPRNVTHVDTDNKWIIAKTSVRNQDSYWIIDKVITQELLVDSNYSEVLKSQVTGPLDSVSFYDALDRWNVNLKLQQFDWYK